MLYVGIDIAKRFHVACIVNEQDKLLKKSFKFKSSEDGFEELLALLKGFNNNPSSFLIGMEATGLLFENLYLFLKDKGYNVILLNPYQTNRFREFGTMKKSKNDNIDALMIAALLKSGRYLDAYVSEDLYANIKALYRHKASLQKELDKHKRQLATLLAVVFPEFEQLIKDPFSVTSLALLEKYPTAKHYEYASVARILKTFRGIRGNNFNEEKAKKLLALAKSSIYQGNAKEQRAFVIRSHIRMIKTLFNEIDAIEQEMLSLFNALPLLRKEEEKEIMDIIDNLRSIPGVSDKTIFALMSECGNLDRFSSIKKFIGYLGLYPQQFQSGNTTSSGHLAKRGAKLAKKALYQAAIAAIRHNKELNKLYHDKLSQGRSKKESVIIVARKLASIILAIYKNNTPYDPNRVFIQKQAS